MKKYLRSVCLFAVATILICFEGIRPGFSQEADAIPHSGSLDPLDKKDRRVSISPVKQSRGIKTGMVIAYGRVIRPPYVVEYRGERLFVNGVQVKPSLVDERDIAARPKPVLDEKAKQRNDSLWKTTVDMQARARKGESQEKVVEFAKAQPHIRDVKWQHGMLMLIDDEGASLGVMLPQAGSVLPTEQEKKARVEGAKRSDIKNVEFRLKRGECVIFVDSGTSGHLLTKTFPSDIPKIMEDPALSEQDKFRRLNEIFGFEPIARDILANYTPAEWAKK